MIKIAGKDITSIVAEGHIISEIKYGLLTVWQLINSCFGSGIWKGEKAWKSEDKWKSFNS